MATMSVTERAEEIGRQHRESYRSQFGMYPERGRVGDWDVSGIDAMWSLVSVEFPTRGTWAETYDWDAIREAYLHALFGEQQSD